MSSRHQSAEEPGKQKKKCGERGLLPPVLGYSSSLASVYGPLGFVVFSWTKMYSGPVPLNSQLFFRIFGYVTLFIASWTVLFVKSFLGVEKLFFLSYYKYM